MNVIFPGSFDPLTKGHEDIIDRIVDIFGHVDVLILNNYNKKHTFSILERKEMILKIFENNTKVKVNIYNGLLADYIKQNHVDIIVRALRNTLDFENEKINAKINKELADVETFVFHVDIIVRALRNTLDFENEKINAKINKELADVETFVLFSQKNNEYISSTIVKDIYFNGGDVSSYVDKVVLEMLNDKFRRNE